MKAGKLISIIIPAYNEESRIKRTICTIIQYLNLHKIPAEIIVVNDGSNDNTAQILKQLSKEYQNLKCIHLPQNRGKGFAIKEGVLASKGQFILFSDADLSTPIQEMDKLIPHLKDGYHIAIGSRRLPESNIKNPQPLHRRLMGRGFATLVKLLIPGIQDTQCGFKAFRRDIAHLLFSCQRIRRFCFDVELLYLARKHRLKIKEVPVCWINSPHTSVRLLRDPMNMFLDLLRIKLNDILGRYG